MTLVGLLILLIIAVAVVWVATHLPQPLNWVVIAIVAVVLLLVLLNGAHIAGARLT